MSAPTWKFPFKPIAVSENHLARMNPSQYTIESKWDGWRAIVTIDDEITLWTRDKVRIETPDNIKKQLINMKIPKGTILDGELWNPLKRGSWRHNRSVQCNLTLWDVIKSGDKDVGQDPIEARRNELRRIVNPTTEVTIVEVLPATMDVYNRLKDEANAFRTENSSRSGFIHGVVLKRNGSPRRDHATRCVEHPDWLKVLFPGLKGWEPRQ